MGWRDWFRLQEYVTARTHGPPPSANGASSFHLTWELPDHGPLDEVAATFELLDEPAVDSLYFWALQVDFADGFGTHGGGHLGFQWHPRYPDRRAVCWGGYARAGGELAGGRTAFPSDDGNPNVCAFPWTTGARWTWRVRRAGDAGAGAPPGATAWRAEVDDPTTGSTVAVRDLWCRGDRLVRPVVWSEVFARCDAPPVRVRWTGLRAGSQGRTLAPAAVSVNYQSLDDGGCTNTDSYDDGIGLVQATSTERTTPQGRRLPL